MKHSKYVKQSLKLHLSKKNIAIRTCEPSLRRLDPRRILLVPTQWVEHLVEHD